MFAAKVGRRLIAVAVLLSLVSSVAQADGSGRAYQPRPIYPTGGIYWKQFYTDPSVGYFMPIRSYVPDAIDKANNRMNFAASLPPCAGSNSSACIEKIEIREGSGSWLAATSSRDIGQAWNVGGYFYGGGTKFMYTSTWSEQQSIGLPEGSTTRLWQLPIAHGGGNDYLIGAALTGSVDPAKPDAYLVRGLELAATPVAYSSGSGMSCTDANGTFAETAQGKPGVESTGNCFALYDFPPNVRLRISVKLGNYVGTLSGWLDAHVGNPMFDYDASSHILSLEGDPLTVGTVTTPFISVAQIESTPELCAIHNCLKGDWDLVKRSSFGGIDAGNSDAAVRNYLSIQKYLENTADGMNTVWRASAMSLGTTCRVSNGFSGIVSTNATVYDPSPPVWNADSASLDFRVAAAHYAADGSTFSGLYTLLLNKEVAKCLWGTNYAKGTASVSVVYDNGEQAVASASLNEDANWVRFVAAGFHYSAPTLRARIDVRGAQPTATASATASATPTPSATASATPSPSASVTPTSQAVPKKVTITCVKGKQTKKVTAVKPTCPTGWKKKA